MPDVDDSAGAERAKPPATSEHGSRDRDPGQGQTLGLSRGDVRFALVCGAAILLLMLAHWTLRAWNGARLVEIDRLPAKAYEFRLDVNSATWVEWMQLQGIGETLARRIVQNRAQFGPFADIDDVQRVPGVGAKTLEQIRSHLICTDCSQPGDAQ